MLACARCALDRVRRSAFDHFQTPSEERQPMSPSYLMCG